jgi:hypothetical protein
MIRHKLVVASAVAISLAACSKKDKKIDGYDYAAPTVAPIVESAAPKGLTGSATLLLADNAFEAILDTAATEASFKTFMSTYMFKKDTTGKVAAPVYYRYWVDVLDDAMTQVKTRIAGTEDSADRCWNKELVTFTHKFTVASQEVSAVGKYNCWELQSTPSSSANGGFQKMAFGKDETHFYLMYITSDATTLSTPSQGERIIIAKAALDSTSADIWFIGRSLQGSPSGSNIRGVVNRIIANKTDGSFSFGLSDEGIGSTNCAIYARSNGQKVNIQARTPRQGSSTECQNVENMAWDTGGCYDAASLASTTGCTELVAVPSDFGLTVPFKESDVIDIKEDSEVITKTDFAAAGVTEFK